MKEHFELVTHEPDGAADLSAFSLQEATNSHDYGRKKNGYEYWTVLKEVRDWSELER